MLYLIIKFYFKIMPSLPIEGEALHKYILSLQFIKYIFVKVIFL